MLGSNGIWGDLLNLTQGDISLFSETLCKYKKVAGAVTSSYPVSKGFIGSSPEIYEKIDYTSGKGIVCFFTKTKGTFTHITGRMNAAEGLCIDGADHYELTSDGRAKLTVSLDYNDARTVFIL